MRWEQALEALQAVEGPLLAADPGRNTLTPAESIDRELIHDIWDELRTVLERYLASDSLDGLVQRKHQILGENMYYI